MWAWVIFGAIAVLGAAFAAAPLFRGKATILAAAIALAAAGAGIGLYAMLGRPELAQRSFEPPDPDDLPALVARLVETVHRRPNELQGWVWLGQLYFTLGKTDQAAKAFAEAVRIAKAQNIGRTRLAALLSDYAVALSQTAGAVTPQAEAALRESLAANPKGWAARYYLGIAHASRGDTAAAERLWQGLLADMPANAPVRGEVVDRLAALKAQTGATPDIAAMVDGLAARLAANPDDLEGWRRLVRAYAVLGERGKAQSALARARTQFAADAQGMEALGQTARENGFE